MKILDRKYKLFSKNLRFFITKELKIFFRNSRKKRKKKREEKRRKERVQKKRNEKKRKEKKKEEKREEKRGRRKHKIKIYDIYIRTYVPSELVSAKRNIITDFS